MKQIAPCKDCPDRAVKKTDGKTITCHSYCEKYSEYRKNREEMNAERLRNNEARRGGIEESIHRMQTRRFGHYRKG